MVISKHVPIQTNILRKIDQYRERAGKERKGKLLAEGFGSELQLAIEKSILPT